MIRVGLIVSLRGAWTGGINYFHNLLSSFQRNPNPRLKLVVFTPTIEDAEQYRSDSIEVHRWPEVNLASPWSYPRRAVARVLQFDPVLLRCAERQKIDILTHRSMGRQTSINTLHWEPDFQFKIYPEFFAPEARRYREAQIANVKLWGNILLSSHAAAKNFRQYFPELAQVNTHVLHFSGAPMLTVDPLAREELNTLYPVSGPYFFLPNQFWRHKNHSLVVEALRRTGPEIRVVCTGLMEDYRNPSHVPTLMDTVKKAGLEQRFICLGTVPYRVLVSLMHYSVAVLQPSLFEGWSTTVEESKSMCKRIALSNIDVHLEQAPERALFFAPDSPDELAAHLNRIYSEYDPATEELYVAKRSTNATKNAKAWTDRFVEIIETVTAR